MFTLAITDDLLSPRRNLERFFGSDLVGCKSLNGTLSYCKRRIRRI